MDHRLLNLIGKIIEWCESRPPRSPGHPFGTTVRVVATLRRFSCEGSPRRRLRASVGEVSGSTLRRRLREWAENGVLAKTHALLVAMLRGNPTLIPDS